MINKPKFRTKKENEEKNSSSDDESSNIRDIILDLDEDPNVVIEKILIKIFNQIITNRNDIEENFILFYYKKVKGLCEKHSKKNIIVLLFINVRNIIQKYRRKLFEIPSIVQLRKSYYQKYEFRSNSFRGKYSNKYLKFAIDRVHESCRSSPDRGHYLDYYLIVKNLFNKLRGIKNCLVNASPIIEKIFEYPLSEFETFSILDCAKEDFLKILIHDNFIWSEITKNRGTQFQDVIEDILQGIDLNGFHVNISENKLEYYHHLKKKILTMGKCRSSIDTRYPEDARPVNEIKDDEKNIIDNNINTNKSNIEENNNINNIDNFYEEGKKLINEEDDFDLEDNIINNFGNKDGSLANINMIRFNSKKFMDNHLDFKKAIITSETLNDINNLNESLNLDKNISFTKNKIKIRSHININNLTSNKSDNDIIIRNKFSKKRFHKKIEHTIFQNKKNTKNQKKENKKEKNNVVNSEKEEKVEIPKDLDDLVKYIKDGDNPKNKKKKKNRKKKNKNNANKNGENKEENKKEKNDMNINNKIEEDDDKEIQMIKEDLVKNSINRYKIHKIKFKYKPKFINKITNMKY